MIKFENECVGCPKEMGCLGSGCPYTHVPYLVCDTCGNEVEYLYDTCSGQLCEDCATDEDKEECGKIDSDNACNYVDYEEPDEYDYADLAYEMKRDEEYGERERL